MSHLQIDGCVMDNTLSSFSNVCESIRKCMSDVVDLRSKGKICETEIIEQRIQVCIY